MKLYKYMSFKVGKDFLRNPGLRVTPRSCLNDPFEVCLSSATKSSIETLVKSTCQDTVGETSDNDNIQNFMDLHGIVSLSETEDNLLMWSHYSDEHRGLVVEFEFDEKNPISLFNSDNPPKSADYGFGNVKYRKFRSFPYEVNLDNLSMLRDYYYFTKSDEWIYEKENRYLLPFTMASRVIIDTENPRGKKVASSLQAEGSDNSARFQSFFPSYDTELMAYIWLNSKQFGVMFFILLDERCIRRLFIGANADCELLEPYIRSSFDVSPYVSYYNPILGKYTNVEKAEIHEDRYELKFSVFNSNTEG